MIKQELLKTLETEEGATLYSSFDDIPKNLRDPEVAFKWLESSVNVLGKMPDWSTMQIPKHLFDDDVRRLAVKVSVRALMLINPDETDIYLELVLLATGASSYGYNLIDQRFRTRETLSAIIDHNPLYMSLNLNGQQWIKPLLTQADIDRVSANNYEFMMSVGVDGVAWHCLKNALITHPQSYPDLVGRGHGDLLLKMIQEGGWPAPAEEVEYAKPDDLRGLAFCLEMSERESPSYWLYCAHLQTFPIDQVVEVMNTLKLRKILMDVYPADVLRANSKANRPLRGLLVEDALGL
jgi:hypothetical protein